LQAQAGPGPSQQVSPRPGATGLVVPFACGDRTCPASVLFALSAPVRRLRCHLPQAWTSPRRATWPRHTPNRAENSVKRGRSAMKLLPLAGEPE
jgi:hypothetical protein